MREIKYPDIERLRASRKRREEQRDLREANRALGRRKMGDILLDHESILEEMVDDHDLQYGDILALVYAWLEVHRPGAKEIYLADDRHPIFSYGPKK